MRLELPTQRFQAKLGTCGAVEVIDTSVNGVRVMLMPTVSCCAERSPDPQGGEKGVIPKPPICPGQRCLARASSDSRERNVLDYLSSCFEAHLRGHKVPSLLPAK